MQTESANKMRIPLTICGFHLLVADSAYSCGIRISSIELCKCLFLCLWILQIFLDSAITIADSAKSPIFGAILSGTVFKVFVCGIQNSEEDQREVAKMRIPRQI